MTQPYAEWVADRYCGRKRRGARALVTRPVGVGVPVPAVQRVAPYDRPDHEGGGVTCEVCGLPIAVISVPVHPTCEAGRHNWPPAGCKPARGEGPAKAEYEEHMVKAQRIAEGWYAKPRGNR